MIFFVVKDTTTATFSEVKILRKYEVFLFAVIDDERSAPAYIMNYIQDIEKNLHELWIIVLPIIIIVACLTVSLNFLVLIKRKRIENIKNKQLKEIQVIPDSKYRRVYFKQLR